MIIRGQEQEGNTELGCSYTTIQRYRKIVINTIIPIIDRSISILKF